MREKFIRNAPFYLIVFLLSISLFLSLKALTNYIFILTSQFTNTLYMFFLFGNPVKASIWELLVLVIVSITGWLFSTKHPRLQTIKWKFGLLIMVIIGITIYYTWLLTASVLNVVIPYLYNKVSLLEVKDVWHSIMVGNPDNLATFIVFIPTIIVCLLVFWIYGQYSQYSEDIKEGFKNFEFKSRKLQRLILKGREEKLPDVVLGPDSKTKELIIQRGHDRTLNNSIIGGIGTGKTAALVQPILNQDLHWMAKYINKFPKVFQHKNYHSEEIKGTFLNGISVIEPSNDLCKNLYKLVKAHNIPEECVFYIDPTNPNTPSINPMQGPVDKVAETFALVMEGLAEAGDTNFFFQQSERNHLKHYIYLLKLHNPDEEVTFDMLLDMYNNPILARKMHEQLKKTLPEDIDSIENRDERNHWMIVKQIDEWFDMNLRPSLDKNGEVEICKHGRFRGEPVYYDAKEQYVQGLRNILTDIGANPLIRRVLFGQSNFDFDRHLEFGGVLLVNTAKGELGGLSNLLGKLILISLQNAVFRRKPKVSAYHHILVDEFPDYIYKPFKEFPVQSRKYKVILTIVAQTVAQLADKYGESYMTTLLGGTRHKMVYGDIPDYDAQLFSRLFGEKTRFEESHSEQSVSPLQESPMTRSGVMYRKVKEPILSPSDIIYQEAFQCAVKIVSENRPEKVTQIDANFVPKEEFEVAKIQADDEASAIWMEERNRFLNNHSILLDSFEVEDESNVIIEEAQSDKHNNEEINAESYLEQHIEQPVKANYMMDNTNTVKLPKNNKVTEDFSGNRKSTIVIEKEETTSKEMNTKENVEEVIEEEDVLNDLFGDDKPNASKLGKEELDLLKEIESTVNDNTTENPSDNNKEQKKEKSVDLDSIAEYY